MTRKTVHTIYGLYDPEDVNEQIRYVGYTHFSPEQRIIDHVAGAKKRANTHKKKWIRTLLRRELRPAFKVLEITTSQDWETRERYWIKELRGQDYNLTNGTEGGDGLVNPSAEVRERIGKKVSKLMRGNQYRRGIGQSDEVREKISSGLLNSEKARKAAEAKKGIYPKHFATKRAIKASAKTRTGMPRPDMAPLAKAQAKKNIGSFWVNNGVENKLLQKDAGIPEGFVEGRLMKKAMTTKNRRYITNGTENRMIPADDSIPEGFRLGVTKDESWRTAETQRRLGKKMRELKTGYRWIARGETRRQLPKGEPLPRGWRFEKKAVS
jgi:hypothetical protein